MLLWLRWRWLWLDSSSALIYYGPAPKSNRDFHRLQIWLVNPGQFVYKKISYINRRSSAKDRS
jgi:hypothetical protein